MLWCALGGSQEAQLLLEKGPYFRCIFIPLLHTAVSEHGHIPHCSVHAWAFSTATAWVLRCVLQNNQTSEKLVGHLGHPMPVQRFSLIHPCSIGSSGQTLWANEGGQRKDACFGNLVKFLTSPLLWTLPVSSYLVNTFVIMTNDLPEEKEKDIKWSCIQG